MSSSPRYPRLSRYLTLALHGSSAFIGTYVLIHLSAPLVANIGGSSMASRTMLLGREYYQTEFGETALVLAPIGIHIWAGIFKRLIHPSPLNQPRKVKSPLSITGYATAFLFFPIHFLIHRANPALEDAPIAAVGPAELDFEYVKASLHWFPVRSWLLYGGLVLFTALHTADGLGLLRTTYLVKTSAEAAKEREKTRRRRWGVIAGIVVPVLTGLYFVSQEPLMTFSSTAKRYLASMEESLIYRL
ncbi:hypothetical protein BKA70DRAFT_1249319 [Coprinopsis sp. MPI-PUGE-AT-0042]|nr:hypothetical protein BKA70DRAFT_1249319 [Coprinopsis sp. MPI-PUGE-AT-0042]